LLIRNTGIPTRHSHYSDRRFAYIEASLELVFAGYAQVNSNLFSSVITAGLSKMKVLLMGDAEVNADLVVDLSNRGGEARAQTLHEPLSLPTIRFAVGVIPIVIGSEVAMAARGYNQQITPSKLTVGASAFANAELGFSYSDTLQLSEDCYCVS